MTFVVEVVVAVVVMHVKDEDVPTILSKLVLVESITNEAVVVASIGSASVDSYTYQLVLTAITIVLLR